MTLLLLQLPRTEECVAANKWTLCFLADACVCLQAFLNLKYELTLVGYTERWKKDDVDSSGLPNQSDFTEIIWLPHQAFVVVLVLWRFFFEMQLVNLS